MRRTTSVFPATHSILSAAALQAELLPDYDIGPPSACVLLARGQNDSYFVTAQASRYILRVYRAGWRSPPEIGYELDALAHLARKGVPVAAPVPRRDGGLVRTLLAPEGERHAVLFGYAPGGDPARSVEHSRRYGGALAAIHAATDDFQSRHERPPLDLRHLLERPLAALRPFLARRRADWSYLQGLAERAREQIARLPAARLESGFCHGDAPGWNAHIGAGQTVTFFDFDCCGPGWRAYDLATFRWGPAGRDSRLWAAFLAGYGERRRPSASDLAAVPWLVVARQIWLMGLHAATAPVWGVGWLNDAYFDDPANGLPFLRAWEAEQLARKPM